MYYVNQNAKNKVIFCNKSAFLTIDLHIAVIENCRKDIIYAVWTNRLL